MVDELKQSSIKHIIILAHYGYNNELELAKKIDGVDLIIGGDSHTLLGDFDGNLGPPNNCKKSLMGENSLIMKIGEYSQIVSISFNEAGVNNLSPMTFNSYFECWQIVSREKIVIGDRVEILNAILLCIV